MGVGPEIALQTPRQSSSMADLIVGEPIRARRRVIDGAVEPGERMTPTCYHVAESPTANDRKAAGSRVLERIPDLARRAPLARPTTSRRSYSERLGSSGSLTTPFDLSSAMQALHDPLNSLALEALQQMATDSALLNMHNYFDNPSMRVMEDYLNGPSENIMRELDNPLAKAIAELDKGKNY